MKELTLIKKSYPKEAGLFTDGEVQFWVKPKSTKVFEEKGKITPAIKKAYLEKLEEIQDKKQKFEDGKKFVEFVEPDFETDKAYCFKVQKKETRTNFFIDGKIWVPKSLCKGNTAPLWLLKKKEEEFSGDEYCYMIWSIIK